MRITISHIALVVRDPSRTAALFAALFGVFPEPPAQERRGPPETVIRIGGVWFVLVQGEPRAGRSDDHVAFTVPVDALPRMEEKLTAFGVSSQWSRAETAARSLYFLDEDGHMFELHGGEFERQMKRATPTLQDGAIGDSAASE